MARFSGTLVEEEEEKKPRFGGALVKEKSTFFPRSLSEAGDIASATGSAFTESFAKPLYGALDWAGVDPKWAGGSVLNKKVRQEALENMAGAQEGHGVASTAGSIVGNVSQFALPAGAAMKVAKAKNAIPAAIAADTAYGGLAGAASAEEGERLAEGVKEGALALGGGLLGGALPKFLTGINVKEGVERFMKEGGYLTPGQAATAPLIQMGEQMSTITPFLGRGVESIRDKVTESMSSTFINKVAKRFGGTVTAGGQKGITQVKKIINDGYDAAWSKVKPEAWNSKSQESFAKNIMEEAKFWPADEAATLKRLVRDVNPNAVKKPPAPTNRFERPKALPKATTKKAISLKRVDKKMRDMIEGASDNYDFQQTLIGIRADLRNLAGESANKALKKMDDGYGDFLSVQDAAAKKGFGEFDAPGLAQSARKIGGKDRASRGMAPLQKPAEEVAKILERKGGLPLIDMMKWFGRLGPSVIPEDLMIKFGKYFIGQTRTQRQIKEFFKKNPGMEQMVQIAMAAEAKNVPGYLEEDK